MTDYKQLIECTAGAAETSIGGNGYRFERDHYGRFVSEVHNLVHRACLLSVVHYRAVPDTPTDEEAALGLGEADGLRLDGPTVEEYIAAGYQALNYPPNGYASRSTAEEIEAAIAAQSGDAGGEDDGTANEDNSGSIDTEAQNGDADTGDADTADANADSAADAPSSEQQPVLGLGGEAQGQQPDVAPANDQQNSRRRK